MLEERSLCERVFVPDWQRCVETERNARRAKKSREGQTNPKMETPRRKDLATIATRLDTLLVIVQRRKSQTIRMISGGRDLHCLTCTDDQSQWIMMLADIDHDCESSGDVESLVDSGAACHAWPAQREAWFVTRRDILDRDTVRTSL